MSVDANVLFRLAGLFPASAPLFAVGGYVRDKILGIECLDLDVCAELKVDEIKSILKDTEFVVLSKNLRLGTVIVVSGDFKCEYTTFRTDSYAPGGAHSPDCVEFTSDMKTDCLRRDFKMNAVYYDALSGKFIDFTGGIGDIENKIVSAVDAPDKVFGEDGLRVLRLVRFACELGFEIENETFEAAKRNAWRVKDISAERVLAELNRIFAADTAHSELNLFDAHFRGLDLLDELGLVDALLPELASLKGLEQPKKYHIYDAYRHSAEAFRAAPPDVRWAALLHDVGKAEAVEREGHMRSHDRIGAEMAESILRRLKFPKREINEITKLISLHMKDINGNMSESKLRWFAAQNAAFMPKLISLMRADAYASSGKEPDKIRLEEVYENLKAEGAPMSVKDLKITGNDLVELGIEEKDRADALNELWRNTVMNAALNDREHALAFMVKRRSKE